jgi:hypothetical protein
MSKFNVETRPYQLHLYQIQVPEGQTSSLSSKAAQELATKLSKLAGLVLPIACTTEHEDKYHLLTGFDIYNAAKNSGLEQLWVFVIAVSKAESGEWLELHSLMSKLNDTLIEPTDINRFLEFVNAQKSDVTLVPGIGRVMANKIAQNRPYKDLTHLQSKLGKKRVVNWIRAYKNFA